MFLEGWAGVARVPLCGAEIIATIGHPGQGETGLGGGGLCRRPVLGLLVCCLLLVFLIRVDVGPEDLDCLIRDQSATH